MSASLSLVLRLQDPHDDCCEPLDLDLSIFALLVNSHVYMLINIQYRFYFLLFSYH